MCMFYRHILSLLPQLYLLLLQIEDLTSSVPEIKQLVTEEKVDLLHKIVSSLLIEDRLTSLMCVHKGKVSYTNVTVSVIYSFAGLQYCLRYSTYKGLVSDIPYLVMQLHDCHRIVHQS